MLEWTSGMSVTAKAVCSRCGRIFIESQAAGRIPIDTVEGFVATARVSNGEAIIAAARACGCDDEACRAPLERAPGTADGTSRFG